MPTSSEPTPPAGHLHVDGTPIPCRSGDSVAGALLAAGRLTTSRSIKYRRPRGPSCLNGSCGTCLVRIDGRPNVRACLVPARDGMRVSSQNLLLPGPLDPSDLLGDAAPPLDHHHLLVRPRLANRAMQPIARHLAGLGTLPDHPHDAPPPARRAPQVLVVGAGHAGATAARRLHEAGVHVLAAERSPWPRPTAPPAVVAGLAVFGAYLDEGLWCAAERTDAGDRLWLLRPSHVLLAPGSREIPLPIPGNDLPGVVAAGGLLAELRRSGRPPPEGLVLVGEGPRAASAADRLRARLIPTPTVRAFEGRLRVRAVRTDSAKIPCTMVATWGPRAPAHELASQAGASLAFDGAGFAVRRQPDGRCAAGPWTLWAAGELCGPMAPDRAAEDGLRVASQILQHLTAPTSRHDEASP